MTDSTAGPVADQVRATRSDGVDALINLAGHTPADVPTDALPRGAAIATIFAPDLGRPDSAVHSARLPAARPV